jgi:8-oxo-dGTP diphosphatase
VRPSAYALLRDQEGRIAVVRAKRGWFLPGGGIEANEDAQRAVEREAEEECGFVIHARGIVGNATEIVHSPAGHDGVDKVSVFFQAEIIGTTPASAPEHEVAWLSPSEAIRRLSHKSHQWAVGLHESLRSEV